MAQREKKLQQEQAEEKAARENEKKKKQAAAPSPPRSRDASSAENASNGISRESEVLEKPNKSKKSKKKEPTLPEDFADWKREDYLLALHQRGSHLTEAVHYLGQTAADKEESAALLTTLLENALGDSPIDAQPRRRRTADAKHVEALAEALAANGSPKAMQTLRRLATQELLEPGNRSAALQSLLNRPENDDLTFLALVEAEESLSTGRSPTEASGISKAKLDLIRTTASEGLRLRLARHIASAEAPPGTFERLWPCLSDAHPKNIAAQAVLYQSDRTNAAAKELLEKRFMASPGDSKEVLDQANLLSVVERRLLSIDSLEQGKSAVLLAGLISSPRLRDSLLKTFTMHWEEDPRILASDLDVGGLDPGFLVVVKMLPRRNIASFDADRAGQGGGLPAKSVKGAALLGARQHKERIAQQWMGFSEQVLRAMCRRFRDASASSGASRGDMPIAPQPGAAVVAAFQWEKEQSSPGAPPLRVGYLRCEQRARPSRALAYYRRQTPDGDLRPLQDGAWLDALATNDATTRSVDVLITRPNDAARELADEQQRLIVEALIVECPRIAPTDHHPKAPKD